MFKKILVGGISSALLVTGFTTPSKAETGMAASTLTGWNTITPSQAADPDKRLIDVKTPLIDVEPVPDKETTAIYVTIPAAKLPTYGSIIPTPGETAPASDGAIIWLKPQNSTPATNWTVIHDTRNTTHISNLQTTCTPQAPWSKTAGITLECGGLTPGTEYQLAAQHYANITTIDPKRVTENPQQLPGLNDVIAAPLGQEVRTTTPTVLTPWKNGNTFQLPALPGPVLIAGKLTEDRTEAYIAWFPAYPAQIANQFAIDYSQCADIDARAFGIDATEREDTPTNVWCLPIGYKIWASTDQDPEWDHLASCGVPDNATEFSGMFRVCKGLDPKQNYRFTIQAIFKAEAKDSYISSRASTPLVTEGSVDHHLFDGEDLNTDDTTPASSDDTATGSTNQEHIFTGNRSLSRTLAEYLTNHPSNLDDSQEIVSTEIDTFNRVDIPGAGELETGAEWDYRLYGGASYDNKLKPIDSGFHFFRNLDDNLEGLIHDSTIIDEDLNPKFRVKNLDKAGIEEGDVNHVNSLEFLWSPNNQTDRPAKATLEFTKTNEKREILSPWTDVKKFPSKLPPDRNSTQDPDGIPICNVETPQYEKDPRAGKLWAGGVLTAVGFALAITGVYGMIGTDNFLKACFWCTSKITAACAWCKSNFGNPADPPAVNPAQPPASIGSSFDSVEAVAAADEAGIAEFPAEQLPDPAGIGGAGPGNGAGPGAVDPGNGAGGGGSALVQGAAATTALLYRRIMEMFTGKTSLNANGDMEFSNVIAPVAQENQNVPANWNQEEQINTNTSIQVSTRQDLRSASIFNWPLFKIRPKAKISYLNSSENTGQNTDTEQNVNTDTDLITGSSFQYVNEISMDHLNRYLNPGAFAEASTSVGADQYASPLELREVLRVPAPEMNPKEFAGKTEKSEDDMEAQNSLGLGLSIIQEEDELSGTATTDLGPGLKRALGNIIRNLALSNVLGEYPNLPRSTAEAFAAQPQTVRTGTNINPITTTARLLRSPGAGATAPYTLIEMRVTGINAGRLRNNPGSIQPQYRLLNQVAGWQTPSYVSHNIDPESGSLTLQFPLASVQRDDGTFIQPWQLDLIEDSLLVRVVIDEMGQLRDEFPVEVPVPARTGTQPQVSLFQQFNSRVEDDNIILIWGNRSNLNIPANQTWTLVEYRTPSGSWVPVHSGRDGNSLNGHNVSRLTIPVDQLVAAGYERGEQISFRVSNVVGEGQNLSEPSIGYIIKLYIPHASVNAKFSGKRFLMIIPGGGDPQPRPEFSWSFGFSRVLSLMSLVVGGVISTVGITVLRGSEPEKIDETQEKWTGDEYSISCYGLKPETWYGFRLTRSTYTGAEIDKSSIVVKTAPGLGLEATWPAVNSSPTIQKDGAIWRATRNGANSEKRASVELKIQPPATSDKITENRQYAAYWKRSSNKLWYACPNQSIEHGGMKKITTGDNSLHCSVPGDIPMRELQFRVRSYHDGKWSGYSPAVNVNPNAGSNQTNPLKAISKVRIGARTLGGNDKAVFPVTWQGGGSDISVNYKATASLTLSTRQNSSASCSDINTTAKTATCAVPILKLCYIEDGKGEICSIQEALRSVSITVSVEDNRNAKLFEYFQPPADAIATAAALPKEIPDNRLLNSATLLNMKQPAASADSTSLGAPIDVTAKPLDAATLQVTAAPSINPTPVAEYVLSCSTTQKDDSNQIETHSVVSIDPQVSFPGLATGETYLCSAAAVGIDGRMSEAAQAKPVKVAGPPTAPTNLKTTPGQKEISLEWSPSISGGDQVTYLIKYRPAGKTTGEWSAIYSDTTNATITGLPTNTKYSIQVIATDGNYFSAPTSIEGATAPGQPHAPQIESAYTFPKTGNATLTVTRPVNDGGAPIISYQITCTSGAVKRGSKTDPSHSVTVKVPVPVATQGSLAAEITGLKREKGWYDCQAAAENTFGVGDTSGTTTVARSGQIAAPTNIDASSAIPGLHMVTWNPPSGYLTLRYSIYTSTDNGNSWNRVTALYGPLPFGLVIAAPGALFRVTAHKPTGLFSSTESVMSAIAR